MKISTSVQAQVYLESFIRPLLFQKIIMKNGLETDPLKRFKILLNFLDNPQRKFKSIHVSGTSGKGSTSYLISKILTQSGYKTGLTISPHLEKLNERMQINGKEITNSKLIKYVNLISVAVDKMKKLPVGEPSYFELLLGIAFIFFADEKIDIAVVEVGIEGKYDATMVIEPIITVLTNISLDHTHILGNNIELITREAIYIIRPKTPLVCGEFNKKLKKIILKNANENKSPVFFMDGLSKIQIISCNENGSIFIYKSENENYPIFYLRLLGEFQISNASIALKVSEILNTNGFKISILNIKNAFAKANFAGRFEIIKRKNNIPIILDGAHNPAKIDAFLKSLKLIYPLNKKIFLISFKKDKNAKKLIKKIMPFAEKVIITEFIQTTDLSMRAATTIEKIENQIKNLDPINKMFIYEKSTKKSLPKALKISKETNSLLIVTGSLYLVGEIRSLLRSYR